MQLKKLMFVCAMTLLALAGCGGSGQDYRTVKIGNQTWMAENLNIETPNSWCYDNDTSNCNKYGRLYAWGAAMKACPDGWHLPTRHEWDVLISFAGGDNAGTKLKSKSPDWNGTDDFGFSALPGGHRVTGGSFYYVGSYGHWWTATEDDVSLAYNRFMNSGRSYVNEYSYSKDFGFSVRCLRD
jgi:uncharacterized protein (TIGR02145 family)